MKAWHFLQKDGRLRYPPHTKVKVGQTLTVKGELKMCANGMHGSKRIIDALAFAPGPVICRVELIPPFIHDNDKVVARGRKVMAMADATYVMHEFACRCAEDALSLTKNPDPRSIAAIKAKRDWLAGKITDEQLGAAWKAAREAAWKAACEVACEAARKAAHEVAWEAAREVAWEVAWEAARAAAREAALGAQNTRLTAMISNLFKLKKEGVSHEQRTGQTKGRHRLDNEKRA